MNDPGFPGYKITDLACISGHPKEREILTTLEAATNRIGSLVEEDLYLMAQIFAAMTADLFVAAQELDPEIQEAPEITVASVSSSVLECSSLPDFTPDEAQEVPKTAWQVTNEFRRTPDAHALHRLQFGEDLLGADAVGSETLLAELEGNITVLERVEATYLEMARSAGLVIHPTRPEREPGQPANTDDPSIAYLDYHLYDGYKWRMNTQCFLGECVRNFDISSIARLEDLVTRLPEMFASIIAGEISGVADDIEGLSNAIESAAVEGMPLPMFRAMVASRKLGRLPNVKVNPWLSDLCRDGYLEKGRKDGRVAYWTGPAGWPYPI